MHSKVKFKIYTLGESHNEINWEKVRLKSKVIDVDITHGINPIPDKAERVNDWDWSFTDRQLKDILNANVRDTEQFDIIILYLNDEIEGNYYSRPLGENKFILSSFPVRSYLLSSHIPLENHIIRVIYRLMLTYKAYSNCIPEPEIYRKELMHDATLGCIFDMNGNLETIVDSTTLLRLSAKAIEKLKKKGIETELIEIVEKELKKIRRHWYYNAKIWIEKNVAMSIVLFVLSNVGLSMLANVIYDNFSNIINGIYLICVNLFSIIILYYKGIALLFLLIIVVFCYLIYVVNRRILLISQNIPAKRKAILPLNEENLTLKKNTSNEVHFVISKNKTLLDEGDKEDR